MLQLSFLGGYQIQIDNELVTHFRNAKAIGLLSYLAVEAGRPHTRSALCGLFWPNFKEDSARTNLRQALRQLRASIKDHEAAPPHLLITHTNIQFNPRANCVRDITQFATLAKSGEMAVLEEAIALYKGAFLAGFELDDCPEFELWLASQRRYFHDLALDAMHRVAENSLEIGDYTKAQQFAQQQLNLNRTYEAAHRQMMIALARSGRRTEALQQYDLCQQILREDLDVSPDEETQALHKQIRNGQFGEGQGAPSAKPFLSADPQLSSSPPSLPNNLPAPLAPPVGREQEIEQIIEQLLRPEVRLLTLVGMGGMGKTRLARTVARELVHRANSPFVDGVWFIPLTEIGHDVENCTLAFVAALAETFELSLAFSLDPEQHVLSYLRPKRFLLILDCFEHLTETEPYLVRILRSAPNVKILVTSRESLKITQQTVIRLKGLAVPAAGNDSAPQRFSGIHLFLQQAKRDNPLYAPDADEMNAITQICRVAEGAPLPILLAASWAKDFTAGEILA